MHSSSNAAPAGRETEMVPQRRLEKARSNKDDPELQPSSSSPTTAPPLVRYGAIALVVVAGVGLVVGFAMFATTFYVPWTMVNYASGLVPMWGGFGAAWFFSITGMWWLAPFFTVHHTRRGHVTGLVFASLFTLFGFIGFIGWVQVPDEASGATALLLLWCLPGSLAIAMHVTAIKTETIVAPESVCGKASKEGGGDRQGAQKCCRCCDGRCTAVGFGIFLLLWLLVFAGGTAFNGLISAAEAVAYPPLGDVLTISLQPEMAGTVDMHIFCDGPDASTRSAGHPTVILAHGGGANSVAMAGLQQALINTHGFRTCIYDRLGYGWTPSYYRRANFDDQTFPSDGTLLARLLNAAGEPGPFACGGHSAGAAVCLSFATEDSRMQALVGLDGFPDVVRGGQYEPGLFDPTGDPQATGILPFAFFASVPGLSRGLLGSAGDDFAPVEWGAMMESLYSQERFWHVQYWDLLSDKSSGDSGFYFTAIPGAFQNQTTGFVDYGRTLNVSTTWLVAHATVNKTCTDTFAWDDNCCGDNRFDWCETSESNSAFLLEQTGLYVNTIGLTPGKVFVGADFTDHGFVQEATYIPWIAEKMSERVVLFEH